MIEGLLAALSSVTGVFSLVAFLAVCGAAVAYQIINRGNALVQKAVESQDPNLVAKVNNRYGIDVSKLTKQHAFEVAKMKIRTDAALQALGMTLGIGAFILVVFFGLRLVMDDGANNEAKSELVRNQMAGMLLNLNGVEREQRVALVEVACRCKVEGDLMTLLSNDHLFGTTEHASVSVDAQQYDAREAAQFISGREDCSQLRMVDNLLYCGGESLYIDLDLERSVPLAPPEAIVFHYTASGAGASALGNVLKTRSVGYHFLIDRTGGIVQMADLERSVAHIGRGGIVDGVRLTNSNTIAVSLVNLGQMRECDDGFCNVFGIKTASDEVRELSNSFWHEYPDEQLASASKLIDVLRRNYGEIPVVGQSDVDVRNPEPGPLFELSQTDASPDNLHLTVN